MGFDAVSYLMGKAAGGGGSGGGDIPWNDNFAVNWDFSTALNTRGQSSYSAANQIYTLDGWQMQGGKLDIVSGGIRLSRYAENTAGYFMQRYPSAWTSAFEGIQMTVSAIVDNTMGSFTATMTNVAGPIGDGVVVGGVSVRLYNYGSAIATTVDIGTDTQDYLLKAIKLEVGSVSTLARLIGGSIVLNKTMVADEERIKIAAGMVRNA